MLIPCDPDDCRRHWYATNRPRFCQAAAPSHAPIIGASSPSGGPSFSSAVPLPFLAGFSRWSFRGSSRLVA